MSHNRSVARAFASVPTSDGAGVKLRRSLGTSPAARLDPFLLLDEFFSDDPGDYLAGFPSHPHRGFETVTYMLAGHMRHEDHLGNKGDLGPGDVQWMTAARGIIHSEMPQQTEGRMHGFQLWINLPAREKMKPAAYRDIPATEIPLVELAPGINVSVIAGKVQLGEQTTAGAFNGDGQWTTDPTYLDVHMESGARVTVPLHAEYNAFVYLYSGAAVLSDGTAETDALPLQAAVVLSDGDAVTICAGNRGARLLLLAAKPLNEPVVQYGPFVMNSSEEVEQALQEYRLGTLAG